MLSSLWFGGLVDQRGLGQREDLGVWVRAAGEPFGVGLARRRGGVRAVHIGVGWGVTKVLLRNI